MGISARPRVYRGFATALALMWVLLAQGCETPIPTPKNQDHPRIRVLGTAQDGGIPHAACDCVRCLAAEGDPTRVRKISSLGVILPSLQSNYLIDATPDIREQLAAIRDTRPRAGAGRVDRQPLSGIFLTHAHLGHYTGLAFFGFEAVNTSELDLFVTPRMSAYLAANEPWATLLRDRKLLAQTLEYETYVDLGDGVRIKAFPVPHRDELSDTVGFVLDGPTHNVLFVPDTDGWSDWEPELPERLARDAIDVALIDGTFFSDSELPARAVSSIGHPRIERTLGYLKEFVDNGGRVAFTHFNHSNPVLDPDSSERREVLLRGFEILEDGDEIPL